MEATKQGRRVWDFRRVTADGRVYILRKRTPFDAGSEGHPAQGTKGKGTLR